MPFPKHKPTKETRATVSALASYGVPQDKIAAYINISGPTLRKHYGDELNLSAIKANEQVGQFLFHMASGNAMADGATYGECSRAAMFWAKTRMGWREVNTVNNISEDGSMSPKGGIDLSKLSTDELLALQALTDKAAQDDD